MGSLFNVSAKWDTQDFQALCNYRAIWDVPGSKLFLPFKTAKTAWHSLRFWGFFNFMNQKKKLSEVIIVLCSINSNV